MRRSQKYWKNKSSNGSITSRSFKEAIEKKRLAKVEKMKSCRIGAGGVKAANGEPSILYRDLENTVGDSNIAKDLYALSETDSFKSAVAEPLKKIDPSSFDKNDEVGYKHVITFANSQNRSKGQLATQEVIDAQNIMSQNPGIRDSAELSTRLNKAFYDENGFFNPSLKSLTENGLYTTYEASNIMNSVELQGGIKTTIEKLENTEVIENSSVEMPREFADKENRVNSFGKLIVKNPYVEKQNIIDEFGGKINPDLENIENVTLQKYLQDANNRDQLEQELNSYKRLPHLVEKEGELVPYVIPMLKLNAIKLIDNTQLISDLEVLKQTPKYMEQSKEALDFVQKLEKDLVNIGVDIIGLNTKENYMDLVEPLQTFLLNPNKNNTDNLDRTYRDVFEIGTPTEEVVMKSNSEQALHFIETQFSEEEMFDRGYLKTGKKNTYQKVEKIPFDQLKALMLEQYTQTELANTLDTESRKLKSIKDNEKAKEIVAYKMFFNQPLTALIEAGGHSKLQFAKETFTGNERYLIEDFTADFNIKMLQEKQKDSELHRNFYDNFKITAKGVQLKSEDPLTVANVKTWLESGEITNSEDLINYSLISKNLPSLSSEELPTVFRNKQIDRVLYSNNPSILPLNEEVHSTINENFITSEVATQDFIRTPQGVYEMIETKGETNLYARVPLSQDENYYNLSDIDILEGKDIEAVNKFTTQKLKEGGFVKEKNILSKAEKEKIEEDNFNCL